MEKYVPRFRENIFIETYGDDQETPAAPTVETATPVQEQDTLDLNTPSFVVPNPEDAAVPEPSGPPQAQPDAQPSPSDLDRSAHSEPVETPRSLPTVVVTPQAVQTAAVRLQSQDGLPPSPTRSIRKPAPVKQHVFHDSTPAPAAAKQPEEAAPAAAKQPEEAASAEAKQPEEAAPTAAKQPEEAAPAAAKQPEEAASAVAKQPEEAAPTAAKQPEEAAPAAAKQPEQAAPAVAKQPEQAAPAVAKQAEAPCIPDLAALVASVQGSQQASSPSGGGFQLPPELVELLQAQLNGSATPAPAEPEAPAVPDQKPLDTSVTSSTHRAAYMRLCRFMEGNDAKKFPHMAKLFSGSPSDSGL